MSLDQPIDIHARVKRLAIDVTPGLAISKRINAVTLRSGLR
jgi:hypothetical protein